MFRALHVSLNPNDLSDILSRLVETVAEQGDDMQVQNLNSTYRYYIASTLLFEARIRME